MYHTVQYIVNKTHPLYAYFNELAHLTNNLHNATLFRIKQVLSAMKKDTLTLNEQEVIDEIKNALPIMNLIREKANKRRKENGKPESALFQMPTEQSSFLSYTFLDAMMKATKNTDYFAPLPRQTAQLVIKAVRNDVKNYFASLRAYKKNPSAFLGKPKMPHYRKSGGMRSIPFTNQDCVVNNGFLKFPITKATLQLGNVIPNSAKIKEVKAVPYYSVFKVCVTYDDMKPERIISDTTSSRIIAIDFGVNNIAAIANNVGECGLLFKGGIIKAANQWFNKRRAKIVSGITAGHPTDFCPTSKSLNRLSIKRNGIISTILHNCAKRIIEQCDVWNIDTIVLGVNSGWKQKSNIGKKNNQTFVNIPYYKLQQYITYLAERQGIRVITQEESYTSKASFLDNDFIPVYGVSDTEGIKFSGYRKSRGLYKSKNYDQIINADLNGAGNILRKAFPSAFENASYRFLEEIIVM